MKSSSALSLGSYVCRRGDLPRLMGGGCHLSEAAGLILVLDHRQAEDRPRTLSSETRVFMRALKSWTLSSLPESTSAPQKVEVLLSGFTPDKLRLMEEVPGINPPPPFGFKRPLG